MKRLKKYFIPALFLSALALTFSCDPDKLELTNPNELSPDTYFTTEAQVKSAVNAIYGSLQTTSLYNRHIWFGCDNMSHENIGNPQLEADKRQYLNFTFDDTHGAIEGYWSTCFRGINKANFVINNEARMNENIPDAILSSEMKGKYIGEAKFMRALYYFYLVNMYGGVPIYLGTDPAESEGLPRSTVEQVYAQIETDLVDATTLLRSKADEEVGRATVGAAWALLGKARLFQEKYAEALTALNNVTGYSLEPVFYNNFMEETENGVESIFEVQFDLNAGYGQQWNSDRTDEGKNEGCFRGQEYGCLNWWNVWPSYNTFDEFETAADNGVKDDPRRGYSIYQDGDLYNDGTLTMEIAGSDDYPVRYGWKKYQNYYKAASEGSVAPNTSGINMKVIRYADVLLMKAECEANRPGGSLATAVDYMNEVRQRADVDMPLYGEVGSDLDDLYPVNDLPGFMAALEHERKVELCGEQVRWWDLKRWGRAADFLINESKPTLSTADQNALVFTAPKHLLWPIPKKELDVNLNIGAQNPGY